MYSKNALLQEILQRLGDTAYLDERYAAHPHPLLMAALQEIALDGRDRYATEELLALLMRAQQTVPPQERVMSSRGADDGPSAGSGQKGRRASRQVSTRGGARRSTPTAQADPSPAQGGQGSTRQEDASLQAGQAEILARDMLHMLAREGVVYPTGAGSRTVYVCPTDIWRRLYDLASRSMQGAVQSSVSGPVAYRQDGLALARDEAAFLLYTLRHDVRLTQEGAIFRRQQIQLLQLFEVSEDVLPQQVGWRFGFGRRFHDYPDRLALVYDHLYALGCLLETSDGRLCADAASADAHLQRPEAARGEELFRFWLRTYRPAIPMLRTVVARMAELTRHAWIYADSLQRLWADGIKAYYYESAEQILERRILGMLVHLGVLARGSAEDGAALYRLTPEGAAWCLGKGGGEALLEAADEAPPHVGAVVQSTFDVLLPATAEAAVGRELQMMADIVQSDRMRVYRLTRDSVYRALKLGIGAERMLAFLRAITDRPLPGNVERTLVQWCDAYGKVTLSTVALLTMRDDQTTAEVCRMTPVADRLLREVAPSVLAFPVEDAPFLESFLEKVGYLVRVDGSSRP